jgi:hypothetical protein
MASALIFDAPEASFDRDRLEELKNRCLREARGAYEEWETLVEVRLRWLVSRVRRHPDDFPHIEMVYTGYRVTVLGLNPYGWSGQDFDSVKWDGEWEKESDRHRKLVDTAEALASEIVPFPLAPWQRATRWVIEQWRTRRRTVGD